MMQPSPKMWLASKPLLDNLTILLVVLSTGGTLMGDLLALQLDNLTFAVSYVHFTSKNLQMYNLTMDGCVYRYNNGTCQSCISGCLAISTTTCGCSANCSTCSGLSTNCTRIALLALELLLTSIHSRTLASHVPPTAWPAAEQVSTALRVLLEWNCFLTIFVLLLSLLPPPAVRLIIQ